MYTSLLLKEDDLLERVNLWFPSRRMDLIKFKKKEMYK